MTRCKKNALAAALLAWLATGATMAQVVPQLARLPLYFAAEQTRDGAAQFAAHGSAQDVQISDHEVHISLRQGKYVNLSFAGASPQAHIHGETELTGKINYLTGNDPRHWRTGISTFSRVQVNELYPGIDAIYYGNDQQLEYDFTVAPGTSPSAISIHVSGCAEVSVNAQGDLAVAGGEVLLHKPVIYQMVAGMRREIAGGYRVNGNQNVAFNIEAYDHSAPLVIDPLLTYSSYLGGNGNEEARAIAINTNDGSIFIAGQTLAKNLATTNGVYQPTNHGGINVGDAFVAKFVPQKSSLTMNLAYLTYIGGSVDDEANALAVDPSGNVYLAGSTISPDFPVTNSILKTGGVPGLTNHIGGGIYPYTGTYFPDGFVTELAAGGSNLVFSTFVGGSAEDAINGLALDSANNIYITGYTLSTNLPWTNAVSFTLAGNSQTTLNYLACTNTFFNCNAFIGKIAANGAGLDYLSYFGGQNFDVGTGIAVDPAANVYVTGYTDSTNFPNLNALSIGKNLNSGLNISNNVNYIFDAFVAKFGPTTSSPPLLYSTFLGNTNTDQANAIAVDGEGDAFITGFTTSTNFINTTIETLRATNGDTTNVLYPVIINRLTNNIRGIIYSTNVFLTKIVTTNGNQASIGYSVVFGGTYNDVGYGVAVDPAGNAFVTGSANSVDFPTNNTAGFLRPVQQNFTDAFITAFNSDCSQVLYSAYLGGSRYDAAYGIAVDSQSTVYIAGQTYSVNFPVTTNAANFPIYAGRVKTLIPTYDAFLAEIALNSEPPLTVTAKTNQLSAFWVSTTNGAGGFYLQTSTNLAHWTTVTNGLLATNSTMNFTTLHLTVPMTNSSQFFRLNTN